MGFSPVHWVEVVEGEVGSRYDNLINRCLLGQAAASDKGQCVKLGRTLPAKVPYEDMGRGLIVSGSALVGLSQIGEFGLTCLYG